MWMSVSSVCTYFHMCVPKNRSLCVESAAVHQNSLYLMPWPRYLIVYHWTYKGQLWCDFKSSMIAQQSGQDFVLLGSSTWWQEYKLYNGKLLQFVVQWINLKNWFLNSTLHAIPEKKRAPTWVSSKLIRWPHCDSTMNGTSTKPKLGCVT